MAVIHFTAGDAFQSKVVPADIYPSEITQITGPTKSSSGKSNNMFFDVTIVEGKYKGKILSIAFSTGTKNMSLLGDMQFFPQHALLQIDSAITGREVEFEDYALDTESLLNKPFDAAWGVATVEGHLVNVINSFHPRGYASETPSF